MKMNNVMKKISFLTVLGLMMGQSLHAKTSMKTFYTTFYNETGGDIIVTPQIVTDSTTFTNTQITIPHVAGNINASLKIIGISVGTLPGAKFFYKINRLDFTPVTVKYDPTTYPAGYRINGDPKAKQVLATGLTVPEPGANFIKVINIPNGYFLTTDLNSAYSQEIPIVNNTNTYAIYPSTMYYIKRMYTCEDNDIKSKHPASDFTGKTTWDATTNKIS